MVRLMIAAVATLVVSFPAYADKITCDTRAAKTTPVAQLQKLAKVSKAEAEKAAMARLGGKPGTNQVAKSELEVEDGCVVYSFDIKVSGKSGVEEIMVDAGTGKIVSHKHETALQEAAEKAKDKILPKK